MVVEGEDEEEALDSAIAQRLRDRVSLGESAIESLGGELEGDVLSFVQADHAISAEIMRRERPLRSRVLSTQTTGKPFTDVLDLCKQHDRAQRQKKRDRPARPDPKSRVAVAMQLNNQGATRGARPTTAGSETVNGSAQKPFLILVPAVATSAINMWNVLDFLEGAQFKSTREKKSVVKQKPKSVKFSRKLNGVRIYYSVMDQTMRLSAQDWRRVVAVFTVGQAWQFKGWKWEQPVELFKHARGFHAVFEDDETPPAVLNWAVHILRIPRKRRHLDKQLHLSFWAEMESFLLQRERA